MFRILSAAAITCLVVSATGCGHSSIASPIADRGEARSPGLSVSDSPKEPSPVSIEAGEGNSDKPGPDSAGTARPDHVAVPAEPVKPPAVQRPPADRAPTKPGDAEKITWEDVNLGMQADVVFRPFMINDRVKDLEGRRISIVGYMHPPESQSGNKKFILLKNTQCKFGPGGQADHLADVHLQEGKTTKYTPSPLKIEGTLVIEPFEGPDGNTWSLYRLENAQIR